MKTVYFILCGMILFCQVKVHAQQKEKPIFTVPREGSHSVPNTTKEKIFKFLSETPDSTRRNLPKPEGVVVEMNQTKGILKMKYQYRCDYKEEERYSYVVTYKISDNFFSYKISDFTNSDGKPIAGNKTGHQELDGCAESTILGRRDKIIVNKLMMGIKHFPHKAP